MEYFTLDILSFNYVEGQIIIQNQTVSNVLSFKCKCIKCAESFNNRASLQNHIRISHINVVKKDVAPVEQTDLMNTVVAPVGQNILINKIVASVGQNNLTNTVVAPVGQNNLMKTVVQPVGQNRLMNTIVAPVGQNNLMNMVVEPVGQNNLTKTVVQPVGQNRLMNTIVAPVGQNNLMNMVVEPVGQNNLTKTVVQPVGQNRLMNTIVAPVGQNNLMNMVVEPVGQNNLTNKIVAPVEKNAVSQNLRIPTQTNSPQIIGDDYKENGVVRIPAVATTSKLSVANSMVIRMLPTALPISPRSICQTTQTLKTVAIPVVLTTAADEQDSKISTPSFSKIAIPEDRTSAVSKLCQANDSDNQLTTEYIPNCSIEQIVDKSIVYPTMLVGPTLPQTGSEPISTSGISSEDLAVHSPDITDITDITDDKLSPQKFPDEGITPDSVEHVTVSVATVNYSGLEEDIKPVVVNDGQPTVSNSEISTRRTYSTLHVFHPGYDPKNRTCWICGKTYSSPASLRVHVHLVHSGNKPFVCNICGKKFGRGGDLDQHARRHGRKGKRYKCLDCDADFRTRQAMVTHSYIHSEVKHFRCETCGKTFQLKRQLNNHVKLHDPAHWIVCDLCGDSVHKSNVSYHRKTKHSGRKREHVCATCGKTFWEKQTLKMHCRTHTGERPYKCSSCEKTFAQSWALIVHMRCHTGERPDVCEVCGKGFQSSGDLGKHMSGVHSNFGRPYQCTYFTSNDVICGKSFKFKRTFDQHLRNSHGVEEPAELDLEEANDS